MQIKPELLISTLERSKLSPIYLISGDEPLQIMEVSDAIRAQARYQGVTERILLEVDAGFNWNSLLQEATNLSLFSTKRLIELRLGNKKFGTKGSQILIEYVQNLNENNILLILMGPLDRQAQQAKWYKVASKAGIVVPVRHININYLPDWICRRVKKYGKQISSDNAYLIADRVEGNLLAASQEIEKLCMLVSGKEINADKIFETVSDSTRFNVFFMLDSAYAGDTKRAIRMLRGLASEGAEPIAVYGALMWSYRRLCSIAYHYYSGTQLAKLFTDYHIWDNDSKQAIKVVLSKNSLETLHRVLRFIDRLDRKIKSADTENIWDILSKVLLWLSEKPIAIYEDYPS